MSELKEIPRIYTRCPACKQDTLTINFDGHLLCTWHACPNPIAIDQTDAELEQTRTMLKTVRQQLAAEEKENQELRAQLEKVKAELDILKQQVACGGPLNSERWTLDQLLDELIKVKAVASGRTCVSFENLCWGSSSLWHQTHRENFRKIDRKPEELSRFVLNEFGGVEDDFPNQVLELLQRQKQELEKVKADNERHRKLNLDYENQMIEARREIAASQASCKELVDALENLLEDTQAEEFILNSSVEKAEQALANAKGKGQ